MKVFSDEEPTMKESIAKLSKKFAPLVNSMDENSKVSPEVVRTLSESVLMTPWTTHCE